MRCARDRVQWPLPGRDLAASEIRLDGWQATAVKPCSDKEVCVCGVV